ncbi:hypothetical protein [Photobacterium sp. GB-72]|uniref:hypothetical protein n=1 Tax=Photobacterium sp. GB-72 TaxID=2022105 RepID=UPI000D161FD2|nr:hypothetical protein [Photobacterium sp. GB-72]PSV30617.1 hypothetical protein C9J40_11650 [Photobacterium sp. GB-72]
MNKYFKLLLFFVLAFICIFLFLFLTDEPNKKESESIFFPDHTKKELGFEAEYPAPMKQLQQVLTHSYIKEPTDEPLEINVGLEKLSYESDSQSEDVELIRLQREINKLREMVAKD